MAVPQTDLPEDEHRMSEKNVWFVTGAGRGLGVDITKAALVSCAGNPLKI